MIHNDAFMVCKACEHEMQNMAEDEGGMMTFWCPHCGTVFQACQIDEDNIDNECNWYTPSRSWDDEKGQPI
ncbi:MAG: hypothetical protein WC824_12420 [Bacteroidota bacterium]|jgi:predicted RNA-binding Zn-ribbon protein involved in translation (DUF1610 family)